MSKKLIIILLLDVLVVAALILAILYYNSTTLTTNTLTTTNQESVPSMLISTSTETKSPVVKKTVPSRKQINNQYFLEENGKLYFLGKGVKFVYKQFEGGLKGPGSEVHNIERDRKVFSTYQAYRINDPENEEDRYYFNTELLDEKMEVTGVDLDSFKVLIDIIPSRINDPLFANSPTQYAFVNLATEVDRPDGKTGYHSQLIAEDKNNKYVEKIYRYGCFGDAHGCMGENVIEIVRK